MPTSVAITGTLANNFATVAPTGDLRINLPAVQLFVDTFDTGLDTTNKWTATNGGTGALPTSSVGSSVLNGGTTANSFSKLSSQPIFAPTQPGFLLQLSTCNIPAPVVGAGHMFIGRGTSSATPTIAAPLIQAVGFEFFTDGKLYAVTYMTGTRFVVADLSAYQSANLTDLAAHKYWTYFRGDICYYCIDNQDNVVASFQTGASGPDVNALPLLYQVISNGAAATFQLQVNGVTLGDTAHNTFWLADGTFGFRKATVGATGGLGVSPIDGFKATYSASVTGLVGVAGDILTIFGSATKTVRVTRMEFSGIATAAADMDLTVVKRSTADTAGTAAAATPHDSASAAATATVNSYTAAPTPGTQVGTPLRTTKAEVGTAAAQAQVIVYDFGNGPKQAPVLRGVAQCLALNVSATQAGALYDVSVEWTEE